VEDEMNSNKTHLEVGSEKQRSITKADKATISTKSHKQ